jgi:hypothetical protein
MEASCTPSVLSTFCSRKVCEKIFQTSTPLPSANPALFSSLQISETSFHPKIGENISKTW